MIKLVIFDLDGTLLDTIEDLANSVNHALSQYHFPTHPVEAYNFFVGNGLTRLIERALPEASRTDDTVSMVRAEFMKHYALHSEDCTKPYPGITELVTRLHADGYQLGVASNKVHVATVELVQRFFPNVQFTAVFGQRDGYPVKPNPVILEDILALARVEKNEVMYVGDSGVDAATAYNAKVPFTAVLWGFRPRKELEEAGALQFAQTADELYQLIRSNTLPAGY